MRVGSVHEDGVGGGGEQNDTRYPAGGEYGAHPDHQHTPSTIAKTMSKMGMAQHAIGSHGNGSSIPSR